MTGTETPSALRPCLSSMPDPSFRLMSRMTQAAVSKEVGFLKASADENRMGMYACARSRRSSPSSIPESSSTTKTRFRSCKADTPGLSADAVLGLLEKLKSDQEAESHLTASRAPFFSVQAFGVSWQKHCFKESPYKSLREYFKPKIVVGCRQNFVRASPMRVGCLLGEGCGAKIEGCGKSAGSCG